MVLVYKCVVSGSEMFDNEDPVTELYNGQVLRIPSKLIKDEAEEDDVKINNVVLNFNYQTASFTKKDFMAYFKAYLAAVLENMKKLNKTDEQVAEFKKEAQQFFKFLNDKFADIEFFQTEAGGNCDAATMGIGVWDEGCQTGPNFYFLKEGLKDTKM